MARVAGFTQLVVEFAEERDGLEVDVGLRREERLLRVADKGEVRDLVGAIGERESGDEDGLGFAGGSEAPK